MFKVTGRGDHKETEDYLKKLRDGDIFEDLDRYGQLGVDALADNTPIDSGLTSESWGYRVIKDRDRPGIMWFNTNVVSGVPVAILIQYGHATRGGGYVPGRDFINPAMQSIFDRIVEDVWKKVKS